MKWFITVSLLLLPCVAFAVDERVFDPRVFDWIFYANTNPDIGERTEKKAKDHWAEHGIIEGRQASGAFQSRGYLDRYPDLKKAFGTDYYKATIHYLTNGDSENRIPYGDCFSLNCTYGRWTASSLGSKFFLSGSLRMAGAVDSLVWNNKEFINAHDHGRELQYAVTTPPYGECYNPTEGGSGDDNTGYVTQSKLLSASVRNNVLQTSVNPGFWRAPGESEPNGKGYCIRGVNTEKTSNWTLTKTVTIGVRGQPLAAMFQADVVVPIPVPEALIPAASMIQVEAPTGYLTGEFDHFYALDVTTGEIIPISSDSGEVDTPLLFATADGEYAMAVYTEDPHCKYAKFSFGSHDKTNASMKWSIVCRLPSPFSQGMHLSFTSFICVGTKDSAAQCMKSVSGH